MQITHIAFRIKRVYRQLKGNTLFPAHFLGEDGKVTGLSEQLKELKESKSFLFKPEGDPQFKYEPNKGHGDPKINPFSKEHFNLTQQAQLIKDDPAQAKTLAAQAGVNIDYLGGN